MNFEKLSHIEIVGDKGLDALMSMVEHGGHVFADVEISAFIDTLVVKPYRQRNRLYCRCPIRCRDIMVKPEEVVRQIWVHRLSETYRYPKSLIRVEYPITIGASAPRKADIVVVHQSAHDDPYIVIETKNFHRGDGKEQLKSYCNATGAPLGLWSNGRSAVAWNKQDPNHFLEIPNLPDVNQSIEDVIKQPWTIATLIEKEEQRAQSGQTLRHLIRDIEDEVLANSGHDVFEEVFKLLFTKMFDEIESYENNTPLKFRNTNDNQQFVSAIHTQFDRAKEKWSGVFAEDSEIALSPDHLRVCVGTLEGWKLFNSNLDILDDAFEYLISKSAKGEKGQFFTPRWVIDMCVRMLDPKEGESVIDPSCGSAGFLIHCAFYVWRKILDDLNKPTGHLFSVDPKPPRCSAYVRRHVFGIDFDERVVRVARCINLIAGDGETNVVHLNSLDWKNWVSETAKPDWMDVYGRGWTGLRKHANTKRKRDMDYRRLSFNLCFANPPFGGEIKQSTLLSLYHLSQKPNGKLQSKMHRDVLFVERCINVLAPGGRMAIVLPEGRFNNINDQYLREYIMEHCRILAVVALDPNTFKPHTGISTCVMFLQKWNDEANDHYCPRRDDYEIFFAIQKAQSVNNRGMKVYVKSSGTYVRDSHGHLIVNHDLFNHDNLTQDGVAEEFTRWAHQQGLSFAPAPDHPHETCSQNSFSASIKDAHRAKRCDAQYFHPAHTDLLRAIEERAERVISLGDVLTFNQRGVQPTNIPEGEIDVIRSGSIKEGYIDYESLSTTSREHFNPKAQVHECDILLYTTGANLGRTAIFQATTSRDAMASNHVNILRVSGVSPHYIAFVLNSTVGRTQSDRLSTGGAQREIRPEHIAQIQIPILSASEEKNLVDDWLSAEKYRRESLRHLADLQATYGDMMLHF